MVYYVLPKHEDPSSDACFCIKPGATTDFCSLNMGRTETVRYWGPDGQLVQLKW